MEVVSGKVGEIKRNGASASVVRLATPEQYNQRLIIANCGTRPIEMTDIVFQTEDCTAGLS